MLEETSQPPEPPKQVDAQKRLILHPVTPGFQADIEQDKQLGNEISGQAPLASPVDTSPVIQQTLDPVLSTDAEYQPISPTINIYPIVNSSSSPLTQPGILTDTKRHIGIDIIAWVSIAFGTLSLVNSLLRIQIIQTLYAVLGIVLAVALLKRNNLARILTIIFNCIGVVVYAVLLVTVFGILTNTERSKDRLIQSYEEKIESDPKNAKEYQRAKDYLEETTSEIKNSPTGILARVIPIMYLSQIAVQIFVIWFLTRKSISSEFH